LQQKITTFEQREKQLQTQLQQSKLIQLQQQKKLQLLFSTCTLEDTQEKKAVSGAKCKNLNEGKIWNEVMACPICMEQPKNVSLDSCGHTLCKGCAGMILSTPNKKCPICRKSVKAANPFYL
jgi:hypothetical protein